AATVAPNSDYEPALVGQTRIRGVKPTPDYAVTVRTEAVDSPCGIAALPDGRVLTTEKAGTMRIAAPDGALSDAIAGIPEVNSNSQGGRLGITIDPDFGGNRMDYWRLSVKTSN